MTKEVGDKGFAGLFASETLVRVLSWFLLHPDRRFFQTELVGLADSKLYLVQRALERLENAGLVEKHQEGRRVYYWGIRTHPAFEDLKRMFLKTFQLGELLREAVASEADAIDLAFVYGSVAAGTESEGSDLDLMLVGEITARDASRLGSRLQGLIGREVNVGTYDRAEFRARAKAGDAFVNALLEEPKIWAIGDQDELERLVEER